VTYCFSSFIIVTLIFSLFFFNAPATTEIYTLSLHDALPISSGGAGSFSAVNGGSSTLSVTTTSATPTGNSTLTVTGTSANLSHRSEEHTSELQSQSNLVCRLLLEKKKKKQTQTLYSKTCIT